VKFENSTIVKTLSSFYQCPRKTKHKTLLKRPTLLRKQMRVIPGRDADANMEISVDAHLDLRRDTVLPALDGEVHQFPPLMTMTTTTLKQMWKVKRKK
jgi:hypothetical protein